MPQNQVIFDTTNAASSSRPSSPNTSPTASQSGEGGSSPSLRDGTTTGGAAANCQRAASSFRFPNRGERTKRGCKVCDWEGRDRRIRQTMFCIDHNVCICEVSYSNDDPQPWKCPEAYLTCWEKYHQWYLPKGLYNENGRRSKKCVLFKMKFPHSGHTNTAEQDAQTRESFQEKDEEEETKEDAEDPWMTDEGPLAFLI